MIRKLTDMHERILNKSLDNVTVMIEALEDKWNEMTWS